MPRFSCQGDLKNPAFSPFRSGLRARPNTPQRERQRCPWLLWHALLFGVGSLEYTPEETHMEHNHGGLEDHSSYQNG